MQSPLLTLALAVLSVTLAACNGPDDYEPRPFAGRGARSLDNPPRYGDGNRYVDPAAVENAPVGPAVEPIAPGATVTTPPVPGDPLDPGLKVAPGTTSSTTTTTTTVTPPTGPAATPPPAAATDAPYARAVPGKPGFVYSPHEQGKVLDVTGLRPGTKVKDPQTGAMFRVP